jgi:hypothetical protein
MTCACTAGYQGFFFEVIKMAGDWIKLQKDTPDKPEVLAIAARLGIDQDAVVGKLVRVWSWFDTHTTDGNALSVTFSFIDRLTGVTGFAEQVALVGWLEQKGHELTLPNFDFHNGETAKKRAMGKNRTEKHRSNVESNDASVTEVLPEKRREEKSINKEKAADAFVLPDWMPIKTWEAFLAMRKKIKKPATDKAIELLVAKLERYKANGQDIQAVLEKSITSSWQDVFEIKERQPFANKYDVAHVTTPPPPNQDAALRKIEEDRKKAVPPSLETLAKLAELRKGNIA